MSISGGIGVKLNLDEGSMNHRFLFGEDQGRYIIAIPDSMLTSITDILISKNIFYQNIGKSYGEKIIINDNEEIQIKLLKKIHENWFKNYLKE